jgi:hypothetical protein
MYSKVLGQWDLVFLLVVILRTLATMVFILGLLLVAESVELPWWVAILRPRPPPPSLCGVYSGFFFFYL